MTALPPAPTTAQGIAESREADKGVNPQADPQWISHWLTAQWTELLGAEPEAGDADFFAAGGNSVMATTLAARIRQAGFAHVTLADLLEHSALDGQVELLAAQRWRAPGGEQAGSPASAPGLSHAQRNRLEMVREQLQQVGESAPLSIQLVVEVDGPVDIPALDTAVGQLIERHAALRTRFLNARNDIEVAELPCAAGPYLHVRALRDGDVTQAWNAALAGAREQAGTPFDFRHPPLLAAHLSTITAGRSLLVLTVDHLVADGISMGLLWRDLAELYAAAAAGRPPELPVLQATAQQVLGARESSWQEGAVQLLRAWDDALAGYPLAPLADLAPSDPAEEFQPPQAAEQAEWTVRAPAAARFPAACLAAGVTEHSAAVGLVFQALYRLDGRRDVVVCTAQSGRASEDETNLIGWLSDRVITRLGPGISFGPDGPSVLDSVRHAHERLIFAYRNPVPFHVLVRRYQGTVGARSPRKPYIFVNYSDAPAVGPRLGRARAHAITETAPVTAFPGPGIQMDRDGDSLVIKMATVAGRYPAGLRERFGALLGLAFAEFAQDVSGAVPPAITQEG